MNLRERTGTGQGPLQTATPLFASLLQCSEPSEFADAMPALSYMQIGGMRTPAADPRSQPPFAYHLPGDFGPDLRALGIVAVARAHFHSNRRLRVFPSASTSYSNSTATLFSRAHWGDAVWQYTAPR